jgi:hypothetical protein
MKEIILDNSLIPEEIHQGGFETKYFFKDNEGFDAITNMDAKIVHRNYLDYLCLCWKRHYGVVVSPTILWNMVLNNMAYKVNKTPDVFRKYFSESDEKQEICVQQGGNLIDVKLLVEGLMGRIPTDIMIPCFLGFSTDTENAKIANYTAFLDMVSPYYNYSMYLCGIPKVKVLGTKEDWEHFIDNCNVIAKIIPEFGDYLIKVSSKVDDIAKGSADFSQIFRLDRCGSGSQAEVAGWIRDFYIEQPRVSYPENFISCMAKIDYHNYNDGQDYRMFAGLFTSTNEDGYLVPAFDKMYFQKISATKAVDNAIALNLTTTKVESEVRKIRTKWETE